MQQRIDARRHAEEAADQEDAEATPIDRVPQRSDADHLNRNTADDHHADGLKWAVDDVEQQRAAQRREGKSHDARYGRSGKNGDQHISDLMKALQGEQDTLGSKKADAE